MEHFTQNELAALFIFCIVLAFTFCLGADTNPRTGQKTISLARRAWNLYCDGVEKIFGKDGI